jgi:hypothetical protein
VANSQISLTAILVVIIIGIIVILIILRNKNLFSFGSPTTTTTTPTPIIAVPAVGEFADANPPQACNNVSDGELEQDGDRKEPQIACGFNFLNVEAIAFINYHGINDTLSIKLRGPKHSGIPDDDMCNSIHYINLGSESRAAFGKQSGHTAEYCDFGDPIPAIPENTWVGVKAVEWNEGSGVHMQTYLQNPEGSPWVLAAEIVDNGDVGCGGEDPRAGVPYTTSPCQDVGHPVSTGFRVDGLSGGGDVEFKNLSVREITPPTGTTPPPAEEEEEPEESADLARIIKIGNLI